MRLVQGIMCLCQVLYKKADTFNHRCYLQNFSEQLRIASLKNDQGRMIICVMVNEHEDIIDKHSPQRSVPYDSTRTRNMHCR